MLIEAIRRSMRVHGFNSSSGAVVVAFAWFAQAGTATADCVFEVRPATAQEKQSYGNALALFERAVPPTPAGWTSSPPPDREVKEVCAQRGETITQWSFVRNYDREEGMAERRADAERRAGAIAANTQANAKANEGRIAAIDTQMNAAMQKVQALVAAQKFAEIEAVNKDVERLMNERMRLMGVDQAGADATAIDRDVTRDSAATFAVTVGETNVDTSGSTPYAGPVGRGFRRTSTDSRGNPISILMVILPARTGQPGQTVVRVTGDQARAEALLRAAKLP